MGALKKVLESLHVSIAPSLNNKPKRATDISTSISLNTNAMLKEPLPPTNEEGAPPTLVQIYDTKQKLCKEKSR